MKTDDGSYSLDDLIKATEDLKHHRGNLHESQRVLAGKRALIKQFEDDEALAALKYAEAEARVKKIAAKLK